MLLIKKCNDSQMWYAGLVGTTVYHEPNTNWEADGVYKSRDLGGCLNIVRMGDAEVVEETNKNLYSHLWFQRNMTFSTNAGAPWVITFNATSGSVKVDKADVEVLAKHFVLI